MFDTMTLTKITAGLCGSLLVFLLGGWLSETLFHVGGGHGHGDDHAQGGYLIEVADSGEGAAPAEEVNFEELLAAADPAKGERVFNKCKACHKLEDGANGTGPHLFGVVNRAIGSVPGFTYSSALEGHGGNWDTDSLEHFLESPKDFAPGTKMSFTGLKKAEDRADVIAYLQTFQ